MGDLQGLFRTHMLDQNFLTDVQATFDNYKTETFDADDAKINDAFRKWMTQMSSTWADITEEALRRRKEIDETINEIILKPCDDKDIKETQNLTNVLTKFKNRLEQVVDTPSPSPEPVDPPTGPSPEPVDPPPGPPPP